MRKKQKKKREKKPKVTITYVRSFMRVYELPKKVNFSSQSAVLVM